MGTALVGQFFQKQFQQDLAGEIGKHCDDFDTKSFLSSFKSQNWNDASLMQRPALISAFIRNCLPLSYKKSTQLLLQVCSQFSGFQGIVFPDFVMQYGLGDVDFSLDALGEFTKHSTSEFAIRPFIDAEEAVVMRRMQAWSKHPNEHLRRLSSEGCRPKLPWAKALPRFQKDPAPVFAILRNLMQDDSLYVRKSVGNNLNDIGKDNAALLLDFLEEYKNSRSKNTLWIMKRALRTLIKNGDEKALQLLGFGPANVQITDARLSAENVSINDELTYHFSIVNNNEEPAELLIDYVMGLRKANGTTREKVFKFTQATLGPGVSRSFVVKFAFKKIHARTYYPGEHSVSLQINGRRFSKACFELDG